MKKSIKYVLGVLILSLFVLATSASAATIPDMGAAANFLDLASTSMTFVGGAGFFFNGTNYFGLSPAASSSATGFHPLTNGYFSDSPSPDELVSFNAMASSTIAYNNLSGQTSNGAWGGNLSPTPGVWTDPANTTFNGTLTLDGGYNDVWVFQIGNNLDFTGHIVLSGNVQPCHVFWQVGGTASTTVDDGYRFDGTVIAKGDVTVTSPGINISGRLISLGGSLNLNGLHTSMLSTPTCETAPDNTPINLTLIEKTTNDSGGSAAVSNWTLTAASSTSISGVTGSTAVTTAVVGAGTYTLSESGPTGYTASSWVCVGGTQSGSTITLANGDHAICTITNDDDVPVVVPPISHGGGGSVPPLIRVTKVAIPRTLPYKGGIVIYTEQVSNPGLVALSNVQIVDDKCAPVKYLSGDINNDTRLDPAEIWTYTCRAKITKTTTNTVTAEGVANYVTARDSAMATVTVISKLPNTGFSPIPTFSRSLSLGMKGDDVSTLQTILVQKNFLKIPAGVAKGYFGALTKTAITKYQASVKLPTVGIFGPLTRARLVSDLGK